MPKWVKPLLLAFAGSIALLGVVIGAGGYVLYSKKDDISRSMKQVDEEAAAFGKDHDQEACVDEGIKRAEDCGFGSLLCQSRAGLFLQSCLSDAKPTAGICNGVPGATEIFASVKYRTAKCSAKGHPASQTCAETIQHLESYCHREHRAG